MKAVSAMAVGRGRRRSAIWLTLVLLALTACEPPWRDGVGALRGSQTGQQPPGGPAIFEARCARCHTTTDVRRVGPGLGGLFQRERLPNGRPVIEDNVRAWITQGGGRMPPQRLQAAELDALIAYLKTLE